MKKFNAFAGLVLMSSLVVEAEVVHDGTDDWGRPPHPAVVNPAVGQDSVVSLRGEWEFSPHQMFKPERNNHRVRFFYSREDWPDIRKIQVPGTWESQGVGTNGFSECWDVRWDNSAKRIRHLHMGDGWYRKDVKIPSEWAGRRIWLKVGGVRSIGWFWVNGHQVALNCKYCGTYKYEITPFVKAGENARVVVQVNNAMPSRKGCVAGMHRWGGICRDIELEATPETLIDDVWIRGDFDRRCAQVNVEIAGLTDERGGLTLRASIEGETSGMTLGSSPTVMLEVPLRSFRAWSPERPNLYTGVVELVRDGNVLMRRHERFGVRKLEVRGKELFLNGKPFFVRGFGDDSVYPMTGLPPADRGFHRNNLAIAKASGFNFIRLHSHCEVPEYFDAADELGLLIQAELPYNSDVCCEFFEFDPMRDVKELYLNYRRHPSFGVYSMGNEGSFGKDLDARLHAYVKSVDPDRLKINQDSQVDWVNPPESSDYLGGPISPWPRDSYAPDRPFVCHEYLNLGIKADSRDESLFTGVWEPPFPRAERAGWLARFGLGQAWGDRLQDAQHALQRHYQKSGLESARSDSQCDGYCFWTLIDVVVPLDCGVSGQGWMNAFWQPKRGGYGPSDFAVFNSPDCVLVDLPDTNRVFVSGEEIRADVLLSHYGERPLDAEKLSWTLTLAGGRTVGGDLPTGRQGRGPARKIARLAIPVPSVDRPSKASLAVSFGTVSNSWDVWVFPLRGRRKVERVAVAEVFKAQLDRRYEGLMPESAVDEANVVIAPCGSALARQAESRGKRLLTLKGWDGAPNVKLGWWGMGPQVGTSFPPDLIYGDFPNEGFLTPLWFRLVKTGEKLPLKGLEERDLMAVGEGGFACYAYVARKGRTLMTFGLDLISDTPEGTCLMDGFLDELGKGR